MIKDLIIDLAYDRITLSQALTRSKLIANQIQNETFKNWLSKELNGYEYQDTVLPNYRKIWAEIELFIDFPFGRSQSFPVVLNDAWGDDMKDMIYNHRVIEPIAIVESNISTFENAKAYVNIPGGMVNIIADMYKEQIQQHRGVARSARRPIGKVQLQNILEQTKQKLLDTLQELENQFPKLENDYTMNEENQKDVQNIVTNNIYGDNNPLNVATGQNLTQGDINLTISAENKEKLKSYGVSEKEISELEAIDLESPKGTPNRQSKIMAWLGKVTASLTAKGIYEKGPELIQFVGTLM
ncbi:hypothetical protein ERX46_02810 [Brumimicrobium glaciale]|uniref:AbiTii domain-containing protein n=1 Tax=Brumimicrobium glaciale TaxID=200475 RepID=A0A4Q4KSK1_9FLAO|nr:hypothetical protein [Brumimicrobium glaciale]RYM35942.1 hypothetical protein ERX46_02810 [Brumimicrobium glaciale]